MYVVRIRIKNAWFVRIMDDNANIESHVPDFMFDAHDVNSFYFLLWL